ncbi:gamma-glutamylcyclotransferase [Burkholderia gladioli]|uniref:gamma-glutamylcyclotransferase n=1 Tax=Burkholderia gladioli TaxID=28095 RepID=UPI002B23FD8E|nr:gamma-glutamylcyclotransferase [Burkholderia gladioli]MEB2551066.1 gamma-glutamylcyclotransferase [Burkholderia gladioli]
MLTRHAIETGAYRQQFEAMPGLWTPEHIDASLDATLRERPADADEVWVFGYGSLIWNPAIEFAAHRVARLEGWHRSFCLRMLAGRAGCERPGRMLALEPGGETTGIALRLHAERLVDELRLVWIREMVLGSYRPTWAKVRLDDGSDAHAIAFVADPSREQYERDASVATAAPLIAQAAGPIGSNADYLFRLQAALREHGIGDAYVDALAEAVSRAQRGAGQRDAMSVPGGR